GPNIENKHDERLFFRWDDKKPEPPRLDEIPLACLYECSSEVIKEYNHHLKEYWERQQKKVVELGNQRWPNSTNGVPHPSTFVEKDRMMKIGDLVYVRHDKQGVVTLLRSVSIPRIRYKYLRQDLLQEHLKHCQNYNELCPACRVFGWVREGAKGISTDDQTAYAGRVRFSHGEIKGEWLAEEEITLAILSTPKPTTTSFYLVNPKDHPDPAVTYDTDGARLRGRKVYRHHGQISFAECKSNNKSDQNRTIKGVLNPRTTFTFAVDFENLAQLELGALLYALEMEEGMVHRLGFAKPLGFGSVKVTAE
ncbi:MAG: TIGR03986 family CRISPR-associated RAMP protein, partial [Desulfatirhabdiaceae bacterium]